ncbi:cytokine-inducible SH2-containing protein-like [Eriocheir sinensis]|uniref:Cytokine signaling 2 n=2 Tax=Eriocheir sinensis TaxID=95602 RepID=D1G5I2_ERISI|nr:cytokine-inducible SH2-containing protein-like [Eriocheir sinensis]ACU42699.1 cytokine signaling 2 [Eriocheir sinensis]
MMLVCPGCHVGMAAAPVLPAAHCLPAAHLTAAGVQPPYVCGRMFQMGGAAGLRPCLTVPHDACHVICCLSCPHSCTVLRPCVASEARNSLHTSGGGLLEGQGDNGRSTSPDTKINHMGSHNPFFTTCQAALPAAKACPTNCFLPSPTHSQLAQAASLNPFLVSSSNSLPTTKVAPKVTLTPPPEPEKNDSQVLTETRRKLEESGWYHGSLTWQQAATLLRDTPVGTFLLRDSASPQCLYSLSVNTTNGPTSVRIHYSCGRFRLDCTGHSQRHTPEFTGVVELVEHYVNVASTQVWVDHEGNTFSPIDIRRPLRRSTPSLQHLCRLAISASGGNTKSSSSSDLPQALQSFLQAYPHTV